MVSRYDDVRALFTHPDMTNDRRAFEHYELPEDPMARFLAENNPFLSPEERKQSERSMVELCEYIGELAVERRKNPREDMISDLVTTHDEDDTMTNDEIMVMVAGLVAAGTETTSAETPAGSRSSATGRTIASGRTWLVLN